MIKKLIKFLKKGTDKISESFKDNFIFPAYCSIELLNSIVNDITDMAQFEIGEYKLNINEFNLCDLV